MSTSRLQRLVGRLLYDNLGSFDILENTRPEWLISSTGSRLELDFYIPQLETAIEVQGEQHYKPSSLFDSDEDSFHDRVLRDREKKRVCQERGLLFIEVASESDAEYIIRTIKNSLKPKFSDEERKKAHKKVDKHVFYLKKYFWRGYSEKNERHLKQDRWHVFHLCHKYGLKVPDIVHKLYFNVVPRIE